MNTTSPGAAFDPLQLRHGERLSPEGEDQLLSIATLEDPNLDGPDRHICRGPGGAYHLIEVRPDACVVSGASITFDIAADLATAVLVDRQRAKTAPGVDRLLALAYLAALAEAQRRNHRNAQSSPGVSPASSAAPARIPDPPECAGVAASRDGGRP